MSDLRVILFVALGVLIAVIYPQFWRWIRKEFPAEAGVFPSWLKPLLLKYGGLLAFCVITAVVIVAIFRQGSTADIGSWWKAVALGFGYEASIEKVLFPKTAFPKKRASVSKGAQKRAG